MADKKDDHPSWVRVSGIGVEFAGAVAGFTLVGYWVQRYFDCAPWGVLVGAILGLGGGMYNMIRQSLAAVRQADRGSSKKGPDEDRRTE